MTVQHILLTTDFSEDSRRAYGPTAELAKALGARVTLLHVVNVLTQVPHGAMLAQPVPIGDVDKEKAAAEKAMADELAHLGGLECETACITSDSASHGTVEYAQQHDVDLIALSSHGRSGLRRLVMGSVAELVLRHATVPVLCYPPPAEE